MLIFRLVCQRDELDKLYNRMCAHKLNEDCLRSLKSCKDALDDIGRWAKNNAKNINVFFDRLEWDAPGGQNFCTLTPQMITDPKSAYMERYNRVLDHVEKVKDIVFDHVTPTPNPGVFKCLCYIIDYLTRLEGIFDRAPSITVDIERLRAKVDLLYDHFDCEFGADALDALADLHSRVHISLGLPFNETREKLSPLLAASGRKIEDILKNENT